MILMIDNYDSFTYNIVQYLGELGATVEVRRNDEISLDEIHQLEPEKIVISPGPCTPNEAGISMDVVRKFGQSIPILGICLGHQSIGQAYGGEVVRARRVMHGKLSKVYHDGRGVFQNLPNPDRGDALPLARCLEKFGSQQSRSHRVDGIRGRHFRRSDGISTPRL